jgi:hypothetical protein
MSRSRTTKLLRLARARGWRVRTGSRHYVLYAPDGRLVTTLPYGTVGETSYLNSVEDRIRGKGRSGNTYPARRAHPS